MSGLEKRQKKHDIHIMLDDEEYQILQKKVKERGTNQTIYIKELICKFRLTGVSISLETV